MKYILLLVAIVAITSLETETLDSNFNPGPFTIIDPNMINWYTKWLNKVSSLLQNDGEVNLQIAPFVVPLITTVAPIVWDVVKKIFKW